MVVGMQHYMLHATLAEDGILHFQPSQNSTCCIFVDALNHRAQGILGFGAGSRLSRVALFLDDACSSRWLVRGLCATRALDDTDQALRVQSTIRWAM